MKQIPAIQVDAVSKYFDGKCVVKKLSMQIRSGEVFGFLGPNGSGKTTAIRMLCGLLNPDGGTGSCLGLDIIHDSLKIKNQVGYMPQKFSLYEDLTIQENLDFMARMYSLPDRESVVNSSLQELNLVTRQHQLVGTLSGGWKQRLALAACLLHNPKLLLLDEPTAGVDPKARREFWDKIHQMADKGVTVLVSTHYMDEALRCDRLAYIAYGRLIVVGTPEGLIKQYKQPTLEAVFVHLMKDVKEEI